MFYILHQFQSHKSYLEPKGPFGLFKKNQMKLETIALEY